MDKEDTNLKFTFFFKKRGVNINDLWRRTQTVQGTRTNNNLIHA